MTIDWQATDDSGQASDPPNTNAATEGTVTYTSDPSCDPSNNCATGELELSIDLSDPTVTCAAASFAVNQPGASVSASVADAVSGPVATSVSAPANTSTAGTFSVNLTGEDLAGRTKVKSCSYTVGYVFTGFFQPIDNLPTVNKANAGQTIPVKWRITDYNGVGISTPASFVSITSGSTYLFAERPDRRARDVLGQLGAAVPRQRELAVQLEHPQVLRRSVPRDAPEPRGRQHEQDRGVPVQVGRRSRL